MAGGDAEPWERSWIIKSRRDNTNTCTHTYAHTGTSNEPIECPVRVKGYRISIINSEKIRTH